MYKNQLQELAQRSCFNLPSYLCIREGPDHAPRFKAVVNFNGEAFESPHFCNTLRQAEHSAAEIALHSLSSRAPSHSLAARILDETGVYKNLLQEISQRVGARLPSYTTLRSGLGHLPVFTCTVELAGITFTGEPAKNKKQAEKNAAMAAWSSLKLLAKQESSSSTEPENYDEQEQITIARALLKYRLKEKMAMANDPNSSPFPKKFPLQPDKRPSSTLSSSLLTMMQSSNPTESKILPLIRPNSVPRTRPSSPAPNESPQAPPSFVQPPPTSDNRGIRPHKFPTTGATPYVPFRQYRTPLPPYHGIAPHVTIRTAVPVFSAPPPPRQQQPQPSPSRTLPPGMGHPRPTCIAPPVHVRHAVPVFAAQTRAPPVTVRARGPNFVGPVQEHKQAMDAPSQVEPVLSAVVAGDEPPQPQVIEAPAPPSAVRSSYETAEVPKAVSKEEQRSVAIMESLEKLEI